MIHGKYGLIGVYRPQVPCPSGLLTAARMPVAHAPSELLVSPYNTGPLLISSGTLNMGPPLSPSHVSRLASANPAHMVPFGTTPACFNTHVV